MNSFIYPRTIAVTRPVAPTGVGYQGYSATQSGSETAIVSGIPANIQAKTTLSRPAGLPGAPPSPIVWRIYIPLDAVANGVILDRDIITDDLGCRYQVEASYWNSLGWNIAAIRLEAH